MQLQHESHVAATASAGGFGGNGEVLPEWMEAGVQTADSPVPGLATASSPALTPAPDIPKEPVVAAPPERISQAIQDLITLLPGKPAAVGLENGLIGIVMCLDPETQRLTVPFLEQHCDFQPYVAPPVETGPPLNAHLLVIDDAYISRLVLRRIIEQLPGCTVTEAENGAQALELLGKGLSPDLVICDICMPEMDGLQLLSRIRSTPELRDLEVVMCTSTTDRDSVVQAAEHNVTKFFVKPFKPDEVRSKLREILTQASQRANDRLQDLKERLGLNPKACGELFHQLAEQVREEVKSARNELGAGRTHSAILTLQRLRGSCSLIKDNNLLSRAQEAINAINKKDMFAIMKSLEVLAGEGRRLGALAARMRTNAETEKERPDPLAAAAGRVRG